MKIFNPNIAPLENTALKSNSPVEGKGDKNPEMLRLRKACKDFESIFISYLLKNMRKTTDESDLFGGGLGGDIYQEMFDEQLAINMAQSNQLKIGDILFNKYSRLIQKGGTDKQTPAPNPSNVPIIRTDPLPDATLTAIPKKPVDSNSTDKTDVSLASLNSTIHQAAKKYKVAPGLIKAVIRHESAGDPRAVSAKGAKGLMQLLDSTAEMLGVKDPFNPVENIMAGAKYLSSLIERFSGDLTKALASYNAGPGAVEKYNGIPPYPETIRYVSKVLTSMKEE